jgi:hypothetical protein
MPPLLMHLCMVLITVILFLAALAVNHLLFAKLEFAPGINWIYLPAGVRLLCTLLFAEAGAVGLLLVSWYVSFVFFFPDDYVRAFAGGIIATIAPYGVYRIARYRYGLQTSLANLSTGRLLACAVAFSLASPLLHHLWFAWYDGRANLTDGFVAMVVGDLFGTLLVLYFAKWLLVRFSRSGPLQS